MLCLSSPAEQPLRMLLLDLLRLRAFIALDLARFRTSGGRMFVRMLCPLSRPLVPRMSLVVEPGTLRTKVRYRVSPWVAWTLAKGLLVIQHNGGGTVNVRDFFVEDFGKV